MFIDINNNKAITIREFVELLIGGLIDSKLISHEYFVSDSLKTAQQLMLIDDFDLINSDSQISKRNAAKIIHYTLLNILREKDDEDWTGAQYFKDIYDCHRCVSHIAQTYTKGIIKSSRNNLFGINDTIGCQEARDIINRLLILEKRIIPEKMVAVQIKEISIIDLKKGLLYNGEVDIIDVRDSEAFLLESEFEECQNIPLKKIKLNPYIVGTDKTKPIVLYCDNGYQSKLAGKLLIEYGYINVMVCYK